MPKVMMTSGMRTGGMRDFSSTYTKCRKEIATNRTHRLLMCSAPLMPHRTDDCAILFPLGNDLASHCSRKFLFLTAWSGMLKTLVLQHPMKRFFGCQSLSPRSKTGVQEHGRSQHDEEGMHGARVFS